MSRFAVLKPPASSAPFAAVPLATKPDPISKPARQDRAGKIMVGGHFSAELSRAVKVLAAEQGTTVQALVGEALDLLLRHHGKHPFGER
jgi:hypothetical protein